MMRTSQNCITSWNILSVYLWATMCGTSDEAAKGSRFNTICCHLSRWRMWKNIRIETFSVHRNPSEPLEYQIGVPHLDLLRWQTTYLLRDFCTWNMSPEWITPFFRDTYLVPNPHESYGFSWHLSSPVQMLRRKLRRPEKQQVGSRISAHIGSTMMTRITTTY